MEAGMMRNIAFALALTASGVAVAAENGTAAKEPAAKPSAKAAAAVAAATAAMDKADALFNQHDAKGLAAMLDKTFFGAGPTMSSKADSAEAMATHFEQMLAKGGRITRDGLTIKADDAGDAAWYIADYTFVPKVPPGALPVRRKMRESGVLLKRGKEWKFAMTHMSMVQPDEDAPPMPPTTAAPMKK
jgi:hypothetical protein